MTGIAKLAIHLETQPGITTGSQRSTAAAAITVGRRGADLPWSADLGAA